MSEALGLLLRSLGVRGDDLPASVQGRLGLYRTQSSRRRLLLVAEGVHRAAHVRSLIPHGPGSVLLATSRRRIGELAMDNVEFIDVRPLDEQGGLALLEERCGTGTVAGERAATLRLVELCGGLPLALGIAAARLTTEGLSVEDLVTQLADEEGRLAALALESTDWDEAGTSAGRQPYREPEVHSMSAVLNVAYRSLPADLAVFYRTIGRVPLASFDSTVAAVATERSVPEAVRLLKLLVAARLLDRTSDGRYRMHDLVRLHARACADAEDADPQEAGRALTERLGSHYLVLVAFADWTVRANRLRIVDLPALLRGSDNPFTEGGPAPLDWLDAERDSILTLLREGARHGLHSTVWQLAEVFTVLFLHHRQLGTWKESLELGMDAAVAAVSMAGTAGEFEQATRAEARLRSLLSRPLMDLGAYDGARTQLEAAVECADMTGHQVLQASVREFHGRYLDHADPARAVTAYRTCRELNEQAGEPRGAAIADYFLGCAQGALGENAEAAVTLTAARTALLALAPPDRRMAARALAALGATHDRLGNPRQAVNSLARAAAILRAADATHYEAEALVTAARIAERTGFRSTMSYHWLSRALTVYEQSGNPRAAELRERLRQQGA